MGMGENDTAVARYAKPPESRADEQPVEARPCFGVRRSTRGLAAMLDLRFRTGDRRAFAYSHLLDLALEGGTLITAAFTTATVRIRGRGLAGLYDRVAEQRVAWVQEADRIDLFAEAEPDEDGIHVERIELETETDAAA